MDYSTQHRLLTGNGYTLYNADDGSALNFLNGISVSFTSSDVKGSIYAYVGYYGYYVSPPLLSDGSYEDFSVSQSRLHEGSMVQNQETGKMYKLKMVNAKLIKVERKKITVNDLKDLPLQVGSGAKSYSIAWNGTNFNVISIAKVGCTVQGENYQRSFLNVTKSIPIKSYYDCQCMDKTKNPATKRTSGSPDYTINYDDSITTDTAPFPFRPTSVEYPQGISITTKSGSLHGKIIAEYEVLQEIWGVASHVYKAGTVVTQTSTGASGVIYKDAAIQLVGLQCADNTNTCLKITSRDYSSCGTANRDGSSLFENYLLTQQVTGAKALVTAYSYLYTYSSTSIKVISGQFDLVHNIDVSLPSNFQEISVYANDISVTGVLSFSQNAGFSRNSTSFTVLLSSLSVPQFKQGSPIMINGKSLGSPSWVSSKTGNLLPIKASTVVTYQTYRVVMPGQVVPKLLCYENCPTKQSSVCGGGSDHCSYPTPTVLKGYVSSSGSCSVKGTGYTLTGVGGNPQIKIQWANYTSYEWNQGTNQYTEVLVHYVSFVSVVDPGTTCNNPTLSFTGQTCTTSPSVSLYCSTGADFKDYRQAKSYSFDSFSGALRDVAGGSDFILNTQSQGSVFTGLMFPNTTANKNALLCTWDSTQVCPWQSYDSLDEYYYYQTGLGNGRVSLVDSANHSINFDQEMLLLYRHQGSSSNSGRNYDGVNMLLNYDGGIKGLPTMCVDPKTGEKADCKPSYVADATINYDEVVIRDSAPIIDVLTGDKYYAKAAEISEAYPVTHDTTLLNMCQNDLPKTSLPSIPDFKKLYSDPTNKGKVFPTDSELSGYLHKGKPAVAKGVVIGY